MAQIHHLPREVLALVLCDAVDKGYFACAPQEVCKEWNQAFSPGSEDGLYIPWVMSATCGGATIASARPPEMREEEFYAFLRPLVLSAGAGKLGACQAVLDHVYKKVNWKPDLDFYEARTMEAAIRGGHRELYEAVRVRSLERKAATVTATVGRRAPVLPLHTIYRGIYGAMRSKADPVAARAFRILTAEIRRAAADPSFSAVFIRHTSENVRFPLMCDAAKCARRLMTEGDALTLRDWEDFTCGVAAVGDALIDHRQRLRVLDVSLTARNREMVSLAVRNLAPSSAVVPDEHLDKMMLELWIRHMVIQERVDFITGEGTDVFLDVPHVRDAIERAARNIRENGKTLSVRMNPLLVACGTVAGGVQVWRHLLLPVRDRRRTSSSSHLSALMEDTFLAAYILLDATLEREKKNDVGGGGDGTTEKCLEGFAWARQRLKSVMPVDECASWTLLREAEKEDGEHLRRGRPGATVLYHRRRLVRSLHAKAGGSCGAHEDLVRVLARVGDAYLLDVALGTAREDMAAESAEEGTAHLTSVALAESLFFLAGGRVDDRRICDFLFARLRTIRPCVAEFREVEQAVMANVRGGSAAALNFVIDSSTDEDDPTLCVHARDLVINALRTAVAATSSVYFEKVVSDIAQGSLRKVLIRVGRSTALDMDVAREIERTTCTYHVGPDSPPRATLYLIGLVSKLWHPAWDFSRVMQRVLLVAARAGNAPLVGSMVRRMKSAMTADVFERTVVELLRRDDSETMKVLLMRYPLRRCSLRFFRDKSLMQGHVNSARLLRGMLK